jgi:hypothetical protein
LKLRIKRPSGGIKKVEGKKPKGKEKWKTGFHAKSDAVLRFLIFNILIFKFLLKVVNTTH